MKINHVIIHEIEKEGGKTGAKLTLYNDTVDNADMRVIKLLNELNTRYKYRIENYAIFDKNDPTVFYQQFDMYYKNRSETDFISFAKESSLDLKSRIDTIAQAKGGYLIYAHYEQIRRYVGVFFVRNTIGMSFRKDPNKKKFDIDDVKHIDFENLAMACRVSLDAYRRKDIRYLSFINKKSDDMSQYFTRWISSGKSESNDEDTKQLYQLLNSVPLPIDEKTKKTIERFELLDNAYTSIRNSPNKTVNIRNLSQNLYGDEEYLPKYVQEHNIVINGEFKAHSKTLKKFIRIRVKANNIEIAFPHSEFNKTVRFDENNPNQIIITSEELAGEIRDSLNNEYE